MKGLSPKRYTGDQRDLLWQGIRVHRKYCLLALPAASQTRQCLEGLSLSEVTFDGSLSCTKHTGLGEESYK